MRNSIYHPVWQYKTRNSEERMKITNKQRKRIERATQQVEAQIAASIGAAENYGGVIQPKLPKASNEIRFEEIVKTVSADFTLFKLRRHYQSNAAIWPTS